MLSRPSRSKLAPNDRRTPSALSPVLDALSRRRGHGVRSALLQAPWVQPPTLFLVTLLLSCCYSGELAVAD